MVVKSWILNRDFKLCSFVSNTNNCGEIRVSDVTNSQDNLQDWTFKFDENEVIIQDVKVGFKKIVASFKACSTPLVATCAGREFNHPTDSTIQEECLDETQCASPNNLNYEFFSHKQCNQQGTGEYSVATCNDDDYGLKLEIFMEDDTVIYSARKQTSSVLTIKDRSVSRPLTKSALEQNHVLTAAFMWDRYVPDVRNFLSYIKESHDLDSMSIVGRTNQNGLERCQKAGSSGRAGYDAILYNARNLVRTQELA